ncbi:hypothetical protein GIB67_022718 [Kingdonia uniflora]|uniref:Uncharacterized protein n=1 Tax=Kingdonia uniflora TaxID=39325 RepID=A0A7J7P8G2_9MAGN|nr:hypothetical protein GIB67_022718 [Kingdonia uniflora]
MLLDASTSPNCKCGSLYCELLAFSPWLVTRVLTSNYMSSNIGLSMRIRNKPSQFSNS